GRAAARELPPQLRVGGLGNQPLLRVHEHGSPLPLSRGRHPPPQRPGGARPRLGPLQAGQPRGGGPVVLARARTRPERPRSIGRRPPRLVPQVGPVRRGGGGCPEGDPARVSIPPRLPPPL